MLLAASLMVSCTKSSEKKDGPDVSKTFIPAQNKKFVYDIQSDGSTGTATQWISGQKDSSGIKVYNLHSEIESSGTTMPLDNKIFTLNGKTYNEIKVPEAWNYVITLLNNMPNTTVTNAQLFGFPAYMTMENVIRNGSVLSLDGPLQQGQRIDYISNGDQCSMVQNIMLESGTSVVETIQVPAGSFVCNKFSYAYYNEITSTTRYGTLVGNGEEQIDVWVAHGIGIVKQQSSARLVTMVPLPTGEVREVVSLTNSSTTLKNIQ
ncbi:MAG: hypothetical protein J0G98_07740 [Terrimonas ferruginea]|uniref:hypothetical protein n=1 Tax=Terrimonas ferruginea TaxID=249 RepID=UPI000A432962|nr:hypothetical protein [Terrimonas ferruginea]MBN8782939.1 hypothetical protein [Terrimonas ferruginea]